jgi:hypothetical protein
MARSSRVRQGVFESPLIVALFFYEKLVYSTKVLPPNFRDDKSMTYHALYGCREGFYETVNHEELVKTEN